MIYIVLETTLCLLVVRNNRRNLLYFLDLRDNLALPNGNVYLLNSTCLVLKSTNTTLSQETSTGGTFDQHPKRLGALVYVGGDHEPFLFCFLV